MNNYVLYMHLTPSGKRYFGITKQKPNERWLNGKGYKNNEHFTRAINKYGWNNIEHVILSDNFTKEEACFFERVMITLYDTTNKNNGYNKSAGGEYGISGCKRTAEWNKKISEAKKGKKSSYHTEETKKKIGEANKGKYIGLNNPQAKTIVCLTTKRLFCTVREGSAYYNINDTNICKCCKGKQKYSGKLPDGTKLVWRYLNHKHNNVYHIVGGYYIDNERIARLIEESFGVDESIDYDNLPDII